MTKCKSNKFLINQVLFETGGLLLGFVVCSAFVSSVFYIVGLTMTSLNFWTSLCLLLMIYVLFFSKKRPIAQQYAIKWISIAIFAIILIGSVFIASKIHDQSYDGNYYHKTAVGLLKNGWNPLTESSSDFSAELLNLSADNKIHKWVGHYQNISWLFGSSIYALTNNIESAKAISLIVMTAVFFIAVALLQKIGLKLVGAVIVSLATVLSPIMLSQIFSFYIDGVLGLMLSLYVLLLCVITKRWLNDEKIDDGLIMVSIVLAIMINLKLTGLLMAGVFAFPFGIVWFCKFLRDKKQQRSFFKIIFSLFAAVVVSVCLIGATSYVKNYFTKGNAFYPLLGNEKVDIITTMQPKTFANKSQVEKLLISIFSESSNDYSSANSPYGKGLLSYNNNEIDTLRLPDSRVGGFGIFYGAIFGLTIIALVAEVVFLLRNKAVYRSTLKIVFCIIAGAVLYSILPTESWWARYAPNIYLLTLLALVMAIKMVSLTQKNAVKYAGLVIISLMMTLVALNTNVFLEHRMADLKHNKIIKQQLAIMRDNFYHNPTSIKIRDSFAGVVFNLIDLGVIKFGKNDLQILDRPASAEELEKYHYRAYNDMILY